METTTKRLIRILKGLLDIAWYGNFILIALAFFFLGRELLFNNYVEVSCEIALPQQKVGSTIAINSAIVKEAYLSTDIGKLNFQMKNSLYSQISSFLLFFIIEFLIIGILYNLRKLFLNLKKDRHFLPENVLSLKRVALLVALIYPLKLLIYLISQDIVFTHFTNKYTVKSDASLNVLIIAAIIYIMAAILNRGLELRKENEEFI